MSSYLYFQALYDFHGDSTLNQLSISRGNILRVNSRAPNTLEGWTWGTIVNSTTTTTTTTAATMSPNNNCSGWFPTGYVVEVTGQQREQSNPAILPLINHDQSTKSNQGTTDGTFDGGFMGGNSPALDYSTSNKIMHDYSNPFTRENVGPLDHLRDDDRITITNEDSSRQLVKKLQKGWKKVGNASAKLLHRRRVATEDTLKPSISVTPSSVTQ